MKNLHNKGFTLVELMIVVAIIGILAAIAVPNYQKYQSKARQAEIKLNLSGAYTALQSYMVENSSYTGCLGAIGVAVGNNAAAEKRYYSFGFPAAALMTYSNGTACTSGNGMDFFAAVTAANGGTVAPAPPTSGAAPTASTFVLGGDGNIGGNTRPLDKWTMDQDKTLSNTQSGL